MTFPTDMMFERYRSCQIQTVIPVFKPHPRVNTRFLLNQRIRHAVCISDGSGWSRSFREIIYMYLSRQARSVQRFIIFPATTFARIHHDFYFVNRFAAILRKSQGILKKIARI